MAVSSKAIALDRLNVSANSYIYIYIYAVRSFLPTSPSAPWEAIATTSGTTALQQFSVIAARGVEPTIVSLRHLFVLVSLSINYYYY